MITRMNWKGTFIKHISPGALLLLYCILSCSCPAIGLARDSDLTFNIGFSRSLFTNVNENDARASIKIWSQTIASEQNLKTDPTTQLFDSVAEMTAALANGRTDALGMTFEEYMIIATQVEIDRFFLAQRAGGLREEYVLLTREASGIDGIDGMSDHMLIIHDSARMSLAVYWLESIMKTQKIGASAGEYFAAVKHVRKLSAAVLPVFFGQADTCLVSRSGFSTMVELNPQIGRKLRVVAKSPPLTPSLVCFRKDYDPFQKELVLTALKELHTSSAGRQMLTIFQAEALVEVDAEALEETRTFFNKVFEAR